MSTLIWGAILGIIVFGLTYESFCNWRSVHKLDRTLQDARTQYRKSCIVGHGPVPKNPPPHHVHVHPRPFDWERDS